MSFYAGKYGTKVQCHITKGAHDISTMRGAPRAETVFHTDINYLDYKIFSLSSYTTKYQTLVTHKGNKSVKCHYLSGEIATLIFTNKYAWSLYNPTTGGIYHDTDFYTLIYGVMSVSTIPPVDSCLWVNSPYKLITVNAVRCATISFPKQTWQSGYNWITVDATKTLSIIVWGLKDNGSISPLYSQNRSGEIKINRTKFDVGGYDVLNMKYLSPSYINTVDKKLVNEGSGNTFQLINSTSKSSTINILTNSSKTEIKKGGHVILSSLMGSTMLDSIGSVTANPTWIYSGTKGAGTTWTYWQNLYSKKFINGEVVIILLKPTIATWNPCIDATNSLRGTAYSSAIVVKYNEGYICDLSSYRRSDSLIIRTKQLHGVEGYIKIRNQMIISSSYSGSAGMTSFGGVITAHSLK